MTPERDVINAERAKHLAGRLKAWRKYVATSELRRVVDEAAAMLEQVAAQAQSETTQ